MDFIRTLNGPDLVVQFQKKFGVLPRNGYGSGGSNIDFPQKANGHSTNMAHLNGNGEINQNTHYDKHTVNGDYAKNGLSKRNGYVSHSANGHAEIVPNGNHNPVEVEEMDRKLKDKFNTDEYMITNKFYYYLFHFGANLGNEIFYITFYPFWIWNIDGFVGRRVCIFWALFMYLGQATKDILKIPRPASPPVMRMEKLYALEYGMPSTHAMVGAGFPFSILFLTWQRYVYPVEFGVVVATMWTLLVCCSRLYLGMHSVLDVIAGLVYVGLLMPLYFMSMDSLDNFITTHPLSPIVSIAVPIFFCVYYPKLERWSTARGDTTVILSAASGVCVGMNLAYQFSLMHKAPTPPPYAIRDFDMYWPLLVFLRLIIGVAVLIITRTVMKFVALKITKMITGIDTKVKENLQILCIELPCKFITYFSVAFVSVLVVPGIFRSLGIERDTYFTEM